MNDKLTHFNERGEAVMVDVSAKDITERTAVAEGRIKLNDAAFAAVKNGTAKKGDVLGTARLAGIMAAKKTSDIIPLCHPLFITKASVDFALDDAARTIRAAAQVKVTGKTGVEMEALHAVSAALLTIYDMCKALDRGMEIYDIHLVHKSGGRSGIYDRPAAAGKILAVCISEAKGTVKKPVDSGLMIENFGLQNDAHAGRWHRQISLLSAEAVHRFESMHNLTLPPGAFGENLLIDGIDLKNLPVGTVLKINSQVVLKVSQIGKKCHLGCEIQKQTGECIMPREGIFATVERGGTVCPGDKVSVLPPLEHAQKG